MKTFNTIFSIVFFAISMMAFGAVLFCGAMHQIPFMIGSFIFAALLHLNNKEDENNENKKRY